MFLFNLGRLYQKLYKIKKRMEMTFVYRISKYVFMTLQYRLVQSSCGSPR